MAFNFNWSPLIADTTRARDMLTTALNKSPKPPIIVDDIIVNELNLGSTPPELEILEIGDLAEDRFRGIFKMSYTGDAYLTLGTRVQANPLNTYLSTKPSFASPQPLAASSGLTIPLQITLSDIRLSGFVILVFSRQKGITLVFRNDPLESLKVSSTFDSIPFVRNYLQKEIEGQLRVLFMEDLPAIIHRLSLKLWSPEYQVSEQQAAQRQSEDAQQPIDPLASPPQNATEGFDDGLDSRGFDLNSPSETYASFSQKNLLRLAALTESQRTLSLFTPSIRDTVFRAWASAADRNDSSNGTSTPLQRHTLSRLQSSTGLSVMSSAASQTSEAPSARPSLASFASAPTTYTLSSSMQPRARAGRKRKNRIVNLRRTTTVEEDNISDRTSVSSGYPDTASTGQSAEAPDTLGTSVSQAREGELSTPPRSPRKRVGFQQAADAAAETKQRSRPSTPRLQPQVQDTSNEETPRAAQPVKEKPKRPKRQPLPRMQTLPNPEKSELARSLSNISLTSPFNEGSSGGILEQAWMQKMAAEISRKVAEEKAAGRTWLSEDCAAARGVRGVWRTGSESEVEAPPAYVS